MNAYCLLITVLFLNTAYAQSSDAANDTVLVSSGTKTAAGNYASSAKIKGAWQLPAQVKNAFDKSKYSGWYIEKIIRLDSAGQTIYQFYVNNGNLLDGDHYDNFLKKNTIHISRNGTILHN